MTALITPDLPAIGLEDLNARAALQTRIDRKYLLPAEDAAMLMASLGPEAAMLEIDGLRSFGYESIYFDTADLLSYHQAAQRRRLRFKVRTRRYVDTDERFVEVKTRRNALTVKQRVSHAAAMDDLSTGRAFVDLVLDRPLAALTPTLSTFYRRSTVLLPGAEGRLTIDTDLTWELPRGTELRLPGHAIIETKTGTAPSSADRVLWSYGHRPVQISKYGTGLAALRPDLPSTKWRRLLRTHFEQF